MKKVLIIIGNFLFILLLIYGCIEYTFTPDFGENKKSVSWLPIEATNVSYKKDPIQQSFEFEISEQGFLNWVKEKNHHKSEVIRLTPNDEHSYKQIYRYNMSIETNYKKSMVNLRDGYYCEYVQANGGGYWIGYDRTNGKAYYFASSH